MKSTPYAALLFVVLLAPFAATQNLLSNPGFEAGLTGWSTFGNVFGENSNPPALVPRSGAGVAKIFGNFTGGFSVSGAYQSFAAVPGQSFTLDAWSRHWSSDRLIGIGAPNANWVVMKMAFFNAGGAEIGSAERTILDGSSPIDTWIDNAPVTGTAPVGTTSVQALILFLQPGNAGGAAQIEDVSFTTGSAQSARIQITSAPAYGNPGSITGTVTGVNFATHRVAVYIYIDGAGWWTKPSSSMPTVPIQPDGTFVANVYTCCLDGRATIFVAALLGPGVTPPLASSSCAIPAGLTSLAVDDFERYGRTLEFAGRTWAVKESPTAVGPGANLFTDDPADVFVDAAGRLHLKVVRRGDGRWWSSEVVLVDDVGYGTYWFTTESQVGRLDPNVTFGAFTWDAHCDDTTIPAWPNREIDFEDSRWGNPSDPRSSQVVVQPYTVPGNTIRYNTPDLGPTPTLTRYFTWQPTRIDFRVATGRHSPCSIPQASVLHSSTYLHSPSTGRRVPPSGRQKFRFNIWINGGFAPSDGQTAEVIISDFRYSDRIGVFRAGCGVNPAGSAVLVAGAPAVGNTITLGVDNPTGSQRQGSLAALMLGFVQPIGGFPCGLAVPGFGMAGPIGELLVTPQLSLAGGAWAGPGNPVPFQLTIPADPALEGLSVYTQGVLVDVGGAVPIGLADAFELCIQG